MLHKYSYTKSESLVQICTTITELQIFSRDCFYWHTLFYTCIIIHTDIHTETDNSTHLLGVEWMKMEAHDSACYTKKYKVKGSRCIPLPIINVNV